MNNYFLHHKKSKLKLTTFKLFFFKNHKNEFEIQMEGHITEIVRI